MPLLSRRSGRLLSTVNGKQHATQHDHSDPLPTPPATNSTRSSTSRTAFLEVEEDINRDPESSGDEQLPNRLPDGARGFMSSRQIDGTEDDLPKPSTFQVPVTNSPDSSKSKRSNDSDNPSSDDAIFSSQNSFKKPRTSYSTNIHAQPNAHSRKPLYGKAGRFGSNNNKRGAGIKQSKKEDTESKEPAALPSFKAARGADVFEFGKTESESKFRTSRSVEDVSMIDNTDQRSNSLSPSLSSLSSAPDSLEVEDVAGLDLPVARPYVPTTECTMCGQSVELFLRQEFEDEHARDGQMSYKRQQRFCRYHKQHDAVLIWEDRGYPEIDWSTLEPRMQRHHVHLENVISGTKVSFYRSQLSDRLNERSKTALQALNSDGNKRDAHLGYYGPRGERLMTDHIIAHLSDSLRKQATKDRLVAAAGVSGGVSGFIQAVLVPELAEQLVREDVKVSAERARGIVDDSAELGDLLNPEVDEKVAEYIQAEE